MVGKCVYPPFVAVVVSQLTGPRNASHIEAMCIIHLKILLNNGTLGLPLAIDGRKEIFGIDLIL